MRHARYLVTQSRRRARSWTVTAPGARAVRRSLWICSWQRSGSTWLAEMLCAAPRTRLVYEPANLCDHLVDGRDAHACPLPAPGSPAVDDVVAALRGRLRGPWVDQINAAHVVARRVVKDVRAVAIAGDVRDRVPDCPVVLLVRHPVEIATSAARLGWIDATADALLAEVDSWCDAHAGALADPRLADAHVVTYEDLLHDPRREVARIVNYAGTFDQSWRRADWTRLDPTRPSATEFAGAPPPGRPDDVRVRAATLLAAHGLGALYDARADWHGDADGVARALRAAHAR